MAGKTKWLVAANVLLTAFLFTALLVATAAPRADAVSIFSSEQHAAPLDDGADGSSTGVDDVIDATTPDALVSVTTSGLSSKHTHICLVTASAEATFVADGVFIFGLSLDAETTTREASDRRIEMFNNPDINDDSFEEASTSLAFAGLSGNHTFTFSARKSASGGGNLNVSASSMTVVCMKKDL